jgi:hypothetical protein
MRVTVVEPSLVLIDYDVDEHPDLTAADRVAVAALSGRLLPAVAPWTPRRMIASRPRRHGIASRRRRRASSSRGSPARPADDDELAARRAGRVSLRTEQAR